MKLLDLFAGNKNLVKVDAQELENVRGQLEAINRVQAVIEFALDGTILHANENFLTLTDYRLDEIKGRHHSMFVDSDYRASSAYRKFWDSLARGEYEAGQYKRFGKDNKEIWIQASYSPILDVNGRVIKVVKYATDIIQEAVKK